MQALLHFRPPLMSLAGSFRRSSLKFGGVSGLNAAAWPSCKTAGFAVGNGRDCLQHRDFSVFSTKSGRIDVSPVAKAESSTKGVLPHWNRESEAIVEEDHQQQREYDEYKDIERDWENEFSYRNHVKRTFQEREDRFSAPIRLAYDRSFVENEWEVEWVSREQLLKRSFLREVGHWRGLITMPSGDTMAGEWKDGVLVGRGTLKIKDGAKYEGGYCDADHQRWRGRITFKNGNTQEGEWINGRPYGDFTATTKSGTVFEGVCTGDHSWTGRITHSTGQTYEGEFWHGFRHGHGTLRGVKGYTYTGGWKMGQRHGSGSMSLGNATYEGDYLHDMRHGYGVSRSETGFYEGEWEKGEMHGQGKRVSHKGMVYVGQFRNSRRNGRGVVDFSDGSHFVGNFHNDLRVGAGIFTHFNGDVYKGMWAADMKDGYGELSYPDGSRLEGIFRRGSPYNASGAMVTPRGTIYEGTWVEGLRQGPGKITYKNGESVQGEFRDNLPWNATGTFHPQDERDRIHGVWQEGQLVTTFAPNGSVLPPQDARLSDTPAEDDVRTEEEEEESATTRQQ